MAWAGRYKLYAHHNIPFKILQNLGKILDEDNHAVRRQQFEQQYTNVEIKSSPLTREDFPMLRRHPF
ncbi:MAG: hypothetical protein ACNYNY_00690 [Candidatus Oxydemutatoraceae bacterium WSBS_2016_MAG_OTU14]